MLVCTVNDHADGPVIVRLYHLAFVQRDEISRRAGVSVAANRTRPILSSRLSRVWNSREALVKGNMLVDLTGQAFVSWPVDRSTNTGRRR